MAITKHALIRYQTLDRCFRNSGRRYYINDLLEACNEALAEFEPDSGGIKKRQLYDDIRFMESEAGWSVNLNKIVDGRKKYYRYEDPSFSINNQPLNESEMAQLKSVLGMLSRFTGTPHFEWVNEIVPMLESKLGMVQKDKEVISFESNVDLKGSEHLMPLFNAIVNACVLKVTYQDFKSHEPYEVIFHPYYLKQHNNRWFVLGLHADNQNPCWNMAIDRIIKMEEINLPYQHSNTDWEEYFYDIIGVTYPPNSKLEEVILKFSPEVAPYISTKPLHPSQKTLTDKEGFMQVRLRVVHNYELEALILSYGEKVEVLAPEALVGKIAARTKKTSRLYSQKDEVE